MKTAIALFLVCFALGTTTYAEEEAPTAEVAVETPTEAAVETAAPPAAEAAGREEPQVVQADPTLSEDLNERKTVLKKRLQERLSTIYGRTMKLVIVSPIDFSRAKIGPTLVEILASELRAVGASEVRQDPLALSSLNLEEVRNALIKTKADMLLVCVAKNEGIDLFLYDRRNPLFIYAHSEAYDEETQSNMDEDWARQQANPLLRKLLARYVNDQYYEIPRQENPPVLKNGIPKWVTDTNSLKMVNREVTGRFRVGAHLGAAVVRGTNQTVSSTPMVGAEVGYRVFRHLYAEVIWDTFAYNVLQADVKWLFSSMNTPYKFGVSFGIAYATRNMTWILDETPGLGSRATFFVPGVGGQFPIGDVSLKLDVKAYMSETMDRMLFTFTPGVVAYF